MRRALPVLVAVWCWVAPDAAQAADPWLILPTTAQDASPWMEPAVLKLRRELMRKGFDVWGTTAATDRFAIAGSAPPAELDESDIQLWVKRSRAAVRHLARADYAAAREELAEAQKLADRAAEELNRETERARRVLDTCLYMVRALVETGNETAARTRTRECRQLVPRVEPSEYRHTPAVEALLHSVDDEIAAQPAGALRVESTPSGCRVRLNGIDFGTTPIKLSGLAPGPYGVQVECDEARGRIHHVRVNSGLTLVRVNAAFERAVRTSPHLHLNYPTASIDDRNRLQDAAEIVQVVPSVAVALLTVESESVLRIDVRGAEKRRDPVSAWLRTTTQGPSNSDMAQAVDALLAGRSTDFTSGSPVPRHAWRQDQELTKLARSKQPRPARRADSADGRGRRIAGMTLTIGGAAALIAGHGLLLGRNGAGDGFVREVRDGSGQTTKQQRWLNLRPVMFGVAGTGVGLLVAGLPLALPESDKMPWWGWAAGGAGVALVGLTAFLASDVPADLAGAAECPDSEASARICVNHQKKVDGAALVGITAAPLLTVPLVYWLRPKRSTITPTVQAQRGGATLMVQGRY